MSSPSHTAAWNLRADELDPHASVTDKLRFSLRYAVLAPSSHNTQPWHFILDGDCVTLCADRLRALPVVDPFDRELIISCGAALFNLRVALSHFGLAYAITLFPAAADPDVLAELRILPGGQCDASLATLFDAMPRRVTTRARFGDEPVAAAVQQRLIEAGAAEGADVACLDDESGREHVAELIAKADHAQFDDPRFRRELASWIHPRRGADGMPAYAAGVGALLDVAAPIAASILRTFDLGGGIAATRHKLVVGSPLLLCLATGADDGQAWLAAGMALERVLLTGVNEDLSASYLNQPIEVPALREQLRTLLGLDATPQLLLRLGHGPAVEHSPRRPLAEVVS